MSVLVPTAQPKTPLPISRALISVSDKTHLDKLAALCIEQGIEVLSTGGTAHALRELGVNVQDVADYTGFPEIMDGRVKTLHPRIHGGILGRKGIDDEVLASHEIAYFDLVVVNLYPFEQAIAQPDCDYQTAIENIDIGGPSMLRAAAKNHAYLGVITDPQDYTELAEVLSASGAISFDIRQRWAAKAFAHSADYEAMIARYMADAVVQSTFDAEDSNQNAPSICIKHEGGEQLRYGENPHQDAYFYPSADTPQGTIGAATLYQGKALSYNNLVDADAALECVKSFTDTACVIVKHANPCGIAISDDQLSAYEGAFAGDPTSAFGGIIAFNSTLTATTAAKIIDNQYAELIIAPEVDTEALSILAQKPNIRVMATGEWVDFAEHDQLKAISGGLLVQSADTIRQTPDQWRVVTERAPTEQEWQDLMFAWGAVRFVKSNAIVFAKAARTIGIGAGQMSRVVSVKIAAMKAKEEGQSTQGAVMASDAFFPFADGLEAALAHGLTAVIQPGGSMRDDEVIAAANNAGIAMVMTGTRHFKH